MGKFSYVGLERALLDKNIAKTQLTKFLGLSSRTIAKIAKGETLANRTLQKIADYLKVPVNTLVLHVSDNKILQLLLDGKQDRSSRGLYHELQIRMAFNSNHIEGNRLSEDQMRLIFETNTINATDSVSVDDIFETVHHFRAVDYVIDVAQQLLTEQIIMTLHYILKHNAKDSAIEWFAVGDYKKRANIVGGKGSTKQSEVASQIRRLLNEYNAKSEVSLNDIVELHAEFEQIHPFKDGNGRVGRLIILKECLHHNIIPFIIEDSKKNLYYKGLSEWNNEHGLLIDTCLDAQNSFIKLLDLFEIEH